MILSPDSALYAIEHLQPDDFFRAEHTTIFDACQSLMQRRVGVDFVTLYAHLKTIGVDDVVGGPAYIASLTDGMWRNANITSYCDTLRDLRLRRECLSVADRMTAALALGETSGSDLLSQSEQWLIEIEKARGSGAIQSPTELAGKFMADLDRRLASKHGMTGVTTGFAALNEFTGGWQNKHLILIAARPSVGKSALAGNVAFAAAASGVPVLYFSLEMSSEELDGRIVSALSGVMLYKMQRGYLTDSDQQRIAPAVQRRALLPLYIDDTAGISVPQMRAKARQLQTTLGLGLIVVDYLQLALGGGYYENRQLEVADISRQLLRLAKDLNVPVIALSQLSRKPEARKDSKPTLSDLRESGALEADANEVILLHRDDHKAPGPTAVLIEKQRNGPTGELELHFVRETVQFIEPKE